MNSLKNAFSRENLLKNLNFFAELNLGLILTAVRQRIRELKELIEAYRTAQLKELL